MYMHEVLQFYVTTFTIILHVHLCFIVNAVRKRPREKSGRGEAGGVVKKPPKKKTKARRLVYMYVHARVYPPCIHVY
jgi:hypothetical protein